MRRFLVIVVLLTGCAIGPDDSYIAAPFEQARPVAQECVRQIEDRYPRPDGAVLYFSPASDDTGQAFLAELKKQIRLRGYSVTESAAEEAIQIRILIDRIRPGAEADGEVQHGYVVMDFMTGSERIRFSRVFDTFGYGMNSLSVEGQ